MAVREPPSQKPQVSLRRIESSDRKFLYQLYASTRADEMAAVDWEEEQKEAFLHMQFEAQHEFYQENFSKAQFDIIETDSSPIGRLYVSRSEDEIRIIDIALLPRYRGRGIGTMLMISLLDEAEASERSLRIHVERFNPAYRLYKRLGFSEVEDSGVYIFMEWKPEQRA